MMDESAVTQSSIVDKTVTDEAKLVSSLEEQESILEGTQGVPVDEETVSHDQHLPDVFSNINTDCIKMELPPCDTKEISPKEGVGSTVEKDAGDAVCADKEKSDCSKLDLSELGCCKFYGGRVRKRRFCAPLKKFCSKACAKSVKNLKQRIFDGISPDSEGGGGTGYFHRVFHMPLYPQQHLKFTHFYTGCFTGWHASSYSKGLLMIVRSKANLNDYLQIVFAKAAPESSFKHPVTVDVPGLKPGMKLEAVDRNNPPSYCVATVVKLLGHRVCIRYDGYGNDDSNDFWCNFQAEELHPIGWCAQNGYPLQAPKGINSSLDDWRTFLTQTLTGALAAPQDLFRKSQDHFQPRVHGFEVGMKLEVIHPLRPYTLCAATVTKSLGPYYFAVTTDFIPDIPTYTFCCHSDSPGIFPPAWSLRNGVEFTFPGNYTKKTFQWEKYLSLCRAQPTPAQLFKKVKLSRFKPGMKVEAVDLEHPCTVRVATVIDVMGRLVQLFLDGQSRFQFLDVESPDIYPIGWCQRTGHPLETPFGAIIPDNKVIIPEGNEKMTMPSFAEVMGKHHAAQATQTQVAAVIPRKPHVRVESEKAKESEKESKEKELKDKDDNSNDTDSSDEDDATGSERFYHNKNQIFFNKGCCIGPLLDPEKVSQLPDATSPGKVSTVIRTGLEMVAKAARDPEKVIDLMQEGCGVRVVVKHKGKIFKKPISRVDSRPKLERYLKRFCRRLICCEFFLSLKPVGKPCPDQCKTDDQGNLLGPKGLKAKRSREYFEVKHLGFEKKKRGRKRKSDLLTSIPNEPIVIKRKLMDSNANGVQPHSAVVSSAHAASTTSAPLAVKTTVVSQQHNGVVLQKAGAPVTVITPRVVRSVSAAPTAPGLVTGPVKMACALSMARTADIAAAPVIGQIPRAVAAAPVQMSGGVAVAKQAIQIQKPQSAGLTTNKFNFSGIVTNVSNQRFSTNAGSTGATITFGRAPPNVTIVSSSPSPLVPKRSPGLSSHVSSNGTIGKLNGQISGELQVVGSLNRSGLNYSFGGRTSVVSMGPPSPYNQTHVHRQIRATISSQHNGSASTIVCSEGATNAGSIRPTGMQSHIVKHTLSSTPSPPPLVPSTLLQSASSPLRPSGPTSTTPLPSPTCPSTGTAHMHQARPSSTSTVTVGTATTHSPQTAQIVSPIIGKPPPLTSTVTVLNETVSPTSGNCNANLVQSHGVSPRPIVSVSSQGLLTVSTQHGTPVSSVKGPRMIHHRPTGPHRDQPGHSAPQGNHQGLKQRSVIQPAQQNNINQPSMSSHSVYTSPVHAEKPYNLSHVSSVRTSAPLQSGHRPPSQPYAPGPGHLSGGQGPSKPRDSGTQTSKEEKQEHEEDKEMRGHGEEVPNHDEKSSGPRKRNMWWLKKKRRRRSRLTYIKAKYKKKEEEGDNPNVTSEVDGHVTMSSPKALVLPESEPGAKIADQQPLYMVVPRPLKSVGDEKPKRGRPPKVLLSSRSKVETDLADAVDFSDPDWNAEIEDENRRGKIVKRRRRIKRGGVRLTSPAAYSNASHFTGAPLVKEIGSRLVATLPNNPPPLGVRSPPVSPRQNFFGEKRLSPKLGSYKGNHPFSPHGSVGGSPFLYSESSLAASPPLKSRSYRPAMAEAGTNTSLPGILNGKSLDLPANPATWTVDQVVQYVRATDCANYSNIFLEQEIDGQALMLLSRDSLMQFTRMKLGPTLKTCSYIAQLKARAR